MNRLVIKHSAAALILLCLSSTIVLLSCDSSSESEENYKVTEINISLSDAVKNYDQVGEFHNGIAPVGRNGRYGFVDTLGNEIAPCKYIGLTYEAPGFYTTYVSNHRGLSRQGLIGPDGKRLADDIYTKIEYLPDLQLICCYDGQPKHFFNLEGDEVRPNLYNRAARRKAEQYGEFTKASPFYNGLSLVTYYDRPSKTYYKKIVNSAGDIVMSIDEKNGKYGVVDSAGKEIVPYKYVSIDDYDSGYLLVSDGVHRQGIWDLQSGKETVAPIYNVYGMFGKEFDLVHTFIKNGYLIVRQNNGCSLIDPSDGKIIIGEEVGARGFDILPNNFIRAYFVDKTDDLSYKYAIFDKEGNKVIDQYDYIQSGPQGFTVRKRVEHNGGTSSVEGAFNLKGKNIVEIKYNNCGLPSEGLIPVQHEKNGKFGFVNTKGDYVIEAKYDRAGCFSEGLAPVQIDGKCGYVNRKGEDTFSRNQ